MREAKLILIYLVLLILEISVGSIGAVPRETRRVALYSICSVRYYAERINGIWIKFTNSRSARHWHPAKGSSRSEGEGQNFFYSGKVGNRGTVIGQQTAHTAFQGKELQ